MKNMLTEFGILNPGYAGIHVDPGTKLRYSAQ